MKYQLLCLLGVLLLLSQSIVLSKQFDSAKEPLSADEKGKEVNVIDKNELINIRLLYQNQFDTLEKEIKKDLDVHRGYLHSQYDGLFNNMNNLFIAVVSLAVLFAGIMAIAQWIYGSSKKEAVDSVKQQAEITIQRIGDETQDTLKKIEKTARMKSNEIAKKRVEELVTQEQFVNQLQQLFTEAKSDIVKLRDNLIRQVRSDLTSTRDEILKDKYTVISNAVDESVRSQFKTELNILDRIEVIEAQLKEISSQSNIEITHTTDTAKADFEKEFAKIIGKYSKNKLISKDNIES